MAQGYALERPQTTDKPAVAWKIIGTHTGPPESNTMETLEVLTSDGWKTFSWEDVFMRRRSETIDMTLSRLKEQARTEAVEVL